MKTFKDLYKKYPMAREDMTEVQEREFVQLCFGLYELEGFSSTFQGNTKDAKEYNGKAFEVVGRVGEEDADLCCLPMWKIKFEDGTFGEAYPEEIVPSEINQNKLGGK